MREKYYVSKQKDVVNNVLIHDADVLQLTKQAEEFSKEFNAIPVFCDTYKEFKLHGIKLLDAVNTSVWTGEDSKGCRIPRVEHSPLEDVQAGRKLEFVKEKWAAFPDAVVGRMHIWELFGASFIDIALMGLQWHVVGKHAKDKTVYVKTRASLGEAFKQIRKDEYERAVRVD
jgi:hypothetical protein